MIPDDVRKVCWPPDRVNEALHALATHAGLTRHGARPDLPQDATTNPAWLDEDVAERWIVFASERLGFDCHPVDFVYGALDEQLPTMGVAVVRVGMPAIGALAVLDCDRSRTRVLTPDLHIVSIRTEHLRDALAHAVDATGAADLDAVFEATQIPPASLLRARRVMLADRFAPAPIYGIWQLRRALSAPLSQHLRDIRFGRRLTALVSLHLARYVCLLAAWAIMGRLSLAYRTDHGWLAAWALLLFTLIPLAVGASWKSALLAIEFDALLKQRMLGGMLAAPTEFVRREGAGMLFGRAAEANALEPLVRSGGIESILGALDLVFAAVIMSAAFGLGLGLLATCIVLGAVFFFARSILRHRLEWTQRRLDLTNELVEDMLGHRTKRIQQHPSLWFDRADALAEQYQLQSERLDLHVRLLQAVPNLWSAAGLLLLVRQFIAGGREVGWLALGIAAVALGERALKTIIQGVLRLISGLVVWKQLVPFESSLSVEETSPDPGIAASSFAATPGRVLVDARDLVFGYKSRLSRVLAGTDFVLHSGDRVLLEGPSGGGKSTLASIVAGLVTPDSGLLLAGGLDRKTLGRAGWLQRVLLVPQFHDNYLFGDTLAFNLLVGRRWPARPADVDEARQVCEEIGLGGLLERMPSGMNQIVGETGWQLSHGEKSRVFLARALLQRAPVLILDESLAALDPHTRRLVVDTVMRRVPTLVLIAHP